MKKEYYIYKIINTINKKYYIGAHYGYLQDDYYGSGKSIKEAILKYGKQNFQKNIIKVLHDENEMFLYEEELITQIIVNDRQCYNLALGGRGGKTKRTVVIDNNGEYLEINNNDVRFLSGELLHMTKNMVITKDIDGNFKHVNINDKRYLSGELKHISTNQINVRDKKGDTFSVSVNDSRYLSGELMPANKGMIKVRNIITNEISYTHINNERYLNGELECASKEFSMAITLNGKIIKVSRQDLRLKTGELIRFRKNMKGYSLL